jgi:GTPase SAR1 family protein
MMFLFNIFRDSYPMILVANKVDLVHLRKVTEEQGRELAASVKVWDIFQTFSLCLALIIVSPIQMYAVLP